MRPIAARRGRVSGGLRQANDGPATRPAASVYMVEAPFECEGRSFRRGDLIVARPDHPDEGRRFVSESSLSTDVMLAVFQNEALMGRLTPLGVVPASSSAPDPSPPGERRHRPDRRAGALILEP